MDMKKEFSEKFNQFINIQNENNLLDLQIDDVFIWRLIRSQLFTTILEKEQVVFKPENKSMSILQRVKSSITGAVNLVITPEKWKQAPQLAQNLRITLIDIVNIIPSIILTARLLLKGTTKPVLVSAFIRDIGAGHKITRPIEEKYEGQCLLLDKPSAGLFATHRLDTRALNVISRRFFKGQIKENIDNITDKISQAYNLDRKTVNRLITKQLKAFKAHEAVFLYLFRKSKFEKIYLCWNRYYMPLLSAAKKAGIETLEFQHGTITPYHIMYSWQGYEHVAYSPDKLLCFGPSWPQESNLAKNISPTIIGAPHLEAAQLKHKHVKREADRVVIFSQNLIGIELLKFSIEVARLRHDLQFVFKPHPAEHYIDITQYIENEIPDNYTITTSTDDSYKLMASATYQIGVSSTTLNEGMVFGNRIIVVPLSSWEYLESAINNGHAHLASTPKQAATLLSSETGICDTPEYYYAPVDLSKI
jgi:hypothetical protein